MGVYRVDVQATMEVECDSADDIPNAVDDELDAIPAHVLTSFTLGDFTVVEP